MTVSVVHRASKHGPSPSVCCSCSILRNSSSVATGTSIARPRCTTETPAWSQPSISSTARSAALPIVSWTPPSACRSRAADANFSLSSSLIAILQGKTRQSGAGRSRSERPTPRHEPYAHTTPAWPHRTHGQHASRVRTTGCDTRATKVQVLDPRPGHARAHQSAPQTSHRIHARQQWDPLRSRRRQYSSLQLRRVVVPELPTQQQHLVYRHAHETIGPRVPNDDAIGGIRSLGASPRVVLTQLGAQTMLEGYRHREDRKCPQATCKHSTRTDNG